jgi:hypothetical protein
MMNNFRENSFSLDWGLPSGKGFVIHKAVSHPQQTVPLPVVSWFSYLYGIGLDKTVNALMEPEMARTGGEI